MTYVRKKLNNVSRLFSQTISRIHSKSMMMPEAPDPEQRNAKNDKFGKLHIITDVRAFLRWKLTLTKAHVYRCQEP